jgi:hypothetical protein
VQIKGTGQTPALRLGWTMFKSYVLRPLTLLWQRCLALYFIVTPGTGITTVEQWLRLLLAIMDLFSLGLFISIAVGQIQFHKYFGQATELLVWSNWASFFRERGLMTLLFVVLMLQLIATRIEVRKYFLIATRLFGTRRPIAWEKVDDHQTITMRIISVWILYLLLAWFIDDILIFSLLYSLVFVHNMWGYVSIRKNIRRYFADPGYLPANEPNEEFIMRRRGVAEHYLFKVPHLFKEGLVAALLFAAFLFAVSTRFSLYKTPDAVPYIIVLFTLIGNEILMIKWRVERAKMLAPIDKDEQDLTRKLTGET